MKKWYQSKTVMMGVLLVAFGIAEYIAGLPVGVSIATVVAGILEIILRFVTKAPIGK